MGSNAAHGQARLHANIRDWSTIYRISVYRH
jgi:hypothetical protein